MLHMASVGTIHLYLLLRWCITELASRGWLLDPLPVGVYTRWLELPHRKAAGVPHSVSQEVESRSYQFLEA